MAESLRIRHEEYEDNYDYSIIRRVPVIIKLNIRNFKRFAHNLEQPFSEEFLDVMANTMLYTITNIQDAIFGYQQQDEIIFILRNDKLLDQEPWYQNNIQKISSIVSSLATIGFYKSQNLFSENLSLTGDPVFSAKVFAVPYVTEAINYLIWKQRSCIRQAISCAAYYELSDKFGKLTASRILKEASYEEKESLLMQHCGIDFVNYYPTSLFRGVAAYKSPVVISTKGGDVNRNKWKLNYEVPDFIEDKEFLSIILDTGIDIFRAPNNESVL